MVEQLAEFLDGGTRAGAWSVEGTRLTALMLFRALHGTLDEAIGAATQANRKPLAGALEAFFQRAVGPTPVPDLHPGHPSGVDAPRRISPEGKRVRRGP
jgi:hypothetical protein